MPRTATPAPKIWRNFIENPPSSTAARRFQSLTINSIRRGYGSPSVKFTRPRHASPAEWPAFITGIDDGDDPTTAKKCSFGGFAKYSGLTYPSGGVGPFGSGGSFECACNRCLHCPHARHDSLWISLFLGKKRRIEVRGNWHECCNQIRPRGGTASSGSRVRDAVTALRSNSFLFILLSLN